MLDDVFAVSDGPCQASIAGNGRPVAPARRAKARELIERLVTEGRARIADPDDNEATKRRHAANYAKRHGLELANKHIELRMADRGQS
ncbi:hypothetical protein ACF1GW_08825 [Streptomyces achromogenes]|uniref:hypothetical protein n=1 Tax=Streptomyces achromogenes TaxID=67255 RepID=UPI0036F58F1D